MKINLVIDSISRCGGGLLDAERSLHQATHLLGVRTNVFGLDDDHAQDDIGGWLPLCPTVFPSRQPIALGWSPELRRQLLRTDADLVYRVGLWHLTSRASHAWSRRRNRPEIIAPHGMLDAWALRNSRWKKRVAWWLFESRHLRDAALIRALCDSEARSIRALGLNNPIAVIPNGIDLPVQCPGGRLVKRDSSGLKVLLFLGRIHPKKGLLAALEAWADQRDPTGRHRQAAGRWDFVIAGWAQGGHDASLRLRCDQLGLTYKVTTAEQYLREPDTESAASVTFVGPTYGVQKQELLRRADAFILPSFSEGLPMAILEAWSNGLPVLMTEHCNLPEGFAADAAIKIGTDVESITEGLQALIESTDTVRRSMGQCGRRLVEQRFTWPGIAGQMHSAYQWLLQGGTKPDFIQTAKNESQRLADRTPSLPESNPM